MSFTNSNGSGSTSCCTSMLIILFCIGIIGGSLSIRRLIEYNNKDIIQSTCIITNCSQSDKCECLLVNGRIGTCTNYIINFSFDINNITYYNVSRLCYNIDICINKNIQCYYDKVSPKDSITLQSPQITFLYIIIGMIFFWMIVVCIIVAPLICLLCSNNNGYKRVATSV